MKINLRSKEFRNAEPCICLWTLWFALACLEMLGSITVMKHPLSWKPSQIYLIIDWETRRGERIYYYSMKLVLHKRVSFPPPKCQHRAKLFNQGEGEMNDINTFLTSKLFLHRFLFVSVLDMCLFFQTHSIFVWAVAETKNIKNTFYVF